MRVWTNPETDWTLPTRLAGLGFAVRPPSLQLKAFVHSLWCAKVPLERQAIREFMHPDGGLGLNFSFGSPVTIAGHTYGPGAFFERTVVRSTPVTLLGGSRLVGVRFNPGATARFFNEPLRVLSGLCPSEGELASELRGLHRQLQHASAPFALLEDWLRYRLRPAQSHCELVEHALDDINLNSRSSAPRDVAKTLGVSPRTLQRAFAQLVGVPLQQYVALSRANHARALLKQGMPLADIALAAGYFDQAQFTRDFRRIVGVPPRRYLRRRSQHILQHHAVR